MEDLLDIGQASKRLGVRPGTLRDWVWRRRIVYVKVGRLVRFDPFDLERFVEKSKRHPLEKEIP